MNKFITEYEPIETVTFSIRMHKTTSKKIRAVSNMLKIKRNRVITNAINDYLNNLEKYGNIKIALE